MTTLIGTAFAQGRAVDSESWGALVGSVLGAVVILLLLGYVSSRVASSAGGDSRLFFAIGLLLPVIGLLAAVIYYLYYGRGARKPAGAARAAGPSTIPSYYQPNYLQSTGSLPPVESVPHVEARERALRKRFSTCPFCGADNPSSMNACWKCGESLDGASPRTICPQCQAHVLTSSEFCPDCGNRLAGLG